MEEESSCEEDASVEDEDEEDEEEWHYGGEVSEELVSHLVERAWQIGDGTRCRDAATLEQVLKLLALLAQTYKY